MKKGVFIRHSSFVIRHSPKAPSAFTLIELLVSMAVLTLLIVLISKLFSAASLVTSVGNGHMEADSATRNLLDRMAVDISQMVKRPDVDYFLKSGSTGTDLYGNSILAQPQAGNGLTGSNDQIAFYSQVPGYFTTGTSPSPVSLVAYRVNGDTSSPYYNKLQRLGYGLSWSGIGAITPVSGTSTPVMPVVFTTSGTNAISYYWPLATNNTTANPNYELAGPQVFRMEYYYVLKGTIVSGTSYPSILSNTPWDSRNPGPNHTSVNGLQDVAAIGVVIAVIDSKSQLLVSGSNLTTLAESMQDFPISNPSNTPKPGDLESQWEAAINSANYIPRVARINIRVYSRTFYLPSN